MPNIRRSSRRWTALKIGVAAAAVALAMAVPREVGHFVMLGLFTTSWLAMLVGLRMAKSDGIATGLGKYAWIYSILLLGYVLLMFFGP